MALATRKGRGGAPPSPAGRISVVAVAALAVSGAAAGLDPALSCADLDGFTAGSFRITEAVEKPAQTQPAHCRVDGVIEDEIRFQLLLPDDWNGRFFMGGGGGFVGSVQNLAQSPLFGDTALQRGYATAGTDTGHQASGTSASWALDNEERELNFGYRAVHLTAETSKSIIRHYYGRDSEYDYFIGCSRGGGQAMMESQRYPDDFDGIVAGAPAYDWPGIGAQFLQNQQAIYPDAGNLAEPVITRDNQALLERAIGERCDAIDGV
ncbi:MAG: tannase/feruloyl esterase family alpha/beta hydrolase, partial [Thermoanaerobaculia bacterium]|nr:tannase/feruloyl esterase family alpha/beta hydrolase [Thermoanaerobaculia bacterium]